MRLIFQFVRTVDPPAADFLRIALNERSRARCLAASKDVDLPQRAERVPLHLHCQPVLRCVRSAAMASLRLAAAQYLASALLTCMTVACGPERPIDQV
jgi:hypothetical protein